ncbi:ComEA family DNA-binding protein [Geofilum rhodophaeum]|jgi:DNA uptake protein ComE-like DNA-binding protein|uniref:ComEA family DNA-binding protein n=1 Tax=Geofilum rhodophaeum TaxID=1965019 RepID=UPI000B5204A7|nr:helix-hairpin-helix domain-containing protein [Geofilum rhodophaeum]
MFPRILTLSRREQRGVFILLVLFFVLTVCRISMPHWYPKTDYSVFLGDTLQPVFADLEVPRPRAAAPHFVRPQKTKALEKSVSDWPTEKRPLGINSADTTAWMMLRGIGPVFSRRIVAYRSLLGGFVALEQLYEVYGLSAEQVQSMLPFLVVDSTDLRQLNVNTASVQQLRKHPYIDYYLAKALWDERQLHGRIEDLGEVAVAGLIDSLKWEWLQHYLLCGPTWDELEQQKQLGEEN